MSDSSVHALNSVLFSLKERVRNAAARTSNEQEKPKSSSSGITLSRPNVLHTGNVPKEEDPMTSGRYGFRTAGVPLKLKKNLKLSKMFQAEILFLI